MKKTAFRVAIAMLGVLGSTLLLTVASRIALMVTIMRLLS